MTDHRAKGCHNCLQYQRLNHCCLAEYDRKDCLHGQAYRHWAPTGFVSFPEVVRSCTTCGNGRSEDRNGCVYPVEVWNRECLERVRLTDRFKYNLWVPKGGKPMKARVYNRKKGDDPKVLFDLAHMEGFGGEKIGVRLAAIEPDKATNTFILGISDSGSIQFFSRDLKRLGFDVEIID